ncbi:MAG: hypothetical protein ACYC4B_26410 [Pirellulaceae bacterium]
MVLSCDPAKGRRGSGKATRNRELKMPRRFRPPQQNQDHAPEWRWPPVFAIKVNSRHPVMVVVLLKERTMIHCRLSIAAVCLASILSVRDYALAAGGTDIVATKGQPAHVSPSWPEGCRELVNDASRTSGWNSWFTEWPNDVNQYAFEVKSTDDLNRLITKLAAIKTDLRQIRLSHLKEPNGLGWVTRVPEGNGIPVIFSIGDQARIDEWFKRVRKPFGVMEFTATPEAVPPTLTIFVQNKVVKLDELDIPEGMDVLAGYVPTVFHKSNTTIEQQKAKEGANTPDSESLKDKLDDSSRAAVKKIEAFLESRKKNRTKRRTGLVAPPKKRTDNR